MDPTTPCCPHPACPARGQGGPGNIGIHARQDTRCIWTPCRKTVAATPGTAFSRLRPPAETVALVRTLLAHGCPRHVIVVALGCDERTVAAWGARAGRQGQAVQAGLVEPPRDLGQGQAEESRVKTQGGIVGRARAMMGKTRVGLGGEGSEPRAMPLLRRLRARAVLCGPSSLGELSRGRGVLPPGRSRALTRSRAHGHGGTASAAAVAPCRARTSRQALRTATGWRNRTPHSRWHTRTCRDAQKALAGGLKTAYIERRHAPFRARLVSLTRRGRALARPTLTLQHGMYLSGTVSNFCTPHARLTPIGGGTTPAMAAGITDHGWTVQALLSLHGPPPRWTPPRQRGRPSHALKCLIERWCGNQVSCGATPRSSLA